jgi:hypothetical protein
MSLRLKLPIRLLEQVNQGVEGKILDARNPMRDRKPTDKERRQFQRLLPRLNDGSRWTVETERRGWRVRQVWDVGKTTKSRRRLWLRWPTWNLMKERYSAPQIAAILKEKMAPVSAAV